MTPIKSSCIVCSTNFKVDLQREKELLPILYDDFGVFCQFFCPQNVKTAANEDKALWISFSFCSTCKTILDTLCDFQDQLMILQKEMTKIKSSIARKISNERGKIATIVAGRIETVRKDICTYYKPQVVLSDCSNDFVNSSQPSSPLLDIKEDNDLDFLHETKDELMSPVSSDEECNENVELDNVPFEDDPVDLYHDAGYHEENDEKINISSKSPLKSIAPPITKRNNKRLEKPSKTTTSVEGNLEKVSRKSNVLKMFDIVQDLDQDTCLISQPRKRRAAAALNRVASNKNKTRINIVTKKTKLDLGKDDGSEEEVSSIFGGDNEDEDFNLEKIKRGQRRRAPPKRLYSKLKSESVSKCSKQQFKCNHCRRTFQSLLARNGHVKKNHQGDSKPYECNDCNRKFGKPSTLLGHQKRWHSTKPKSESPNNNDSKDKKQSSVTAFACSECRMIFKSEQKKEAHILRFHQGEKRPYKCGTCDKCYRHKVHLDDHMELHVATGTPFPCKECNKEFLTERKLRVHLAKVHFPGERPFKCDQCTRTFAKVYLLENHMYKHTGQKRYICEICGHNYTSNKRLQVHLQRHASGVESKEPFQCDQCDKVFSEPQSLSSHVMSIHEKKFRFHCEVCGQGCQMLSMLKRHMLCHTQEKSFACEICENKKFKRKPQLVQHMLIHEGKFPYVCPHCGKGFRASEKLKNHEKLHTGEKPYTCSEPGCTKAFALKHYLTNHINTNHKGMKQQKRPKTVEGPPRKGHSTQRVKQILKPSTTTVPDIVVVNRNLQETQIIPVENLQVFQQDTQPILHTTDLTQSQPQQQSLLISTATEAETEAIAASVSNVITISQTGDQQIVTYPEDQSYEWLQFGFIAANPTEPVRIDECEQTGPATVVVSTPSGYKVENGFSTS